MLLIAIELIKNNKKKAPVNLTTQGPISIKILINLPLFYK